jgi:hypothetical protein
LLSVPEVAVTRSALSAVVDQVDSNISINDRSRSLPAPDSTGQLSLCPFEDKFRGNTIGRQVMPAFAFLIWIIFMFIHRQKVIDPLCAVSEDRVQRGNQSAKCSAGHGEDYCVAAEITILSRSSCRWNVLQCPGGTKTPSS